MQRFRDILVVVEEESQHEAALARAVRLAGETGARLTFLDLAGGGAGAVERLLASLDHARAAEIAEMTLARRQARVEAMAATARAAGIEATAEVDEGTGFLAVIARVLRDGHDLVLKGQHVGASRLTGAFRGPDTNLLRKCPCPVWIVQHQVADGARRILACVDADADPGDATRHGLNRTVLELATSLAAWDGATVDILAVWRVEAEGILRSGRFELEPGEIDRLVERDRVKSLERLEAMVAEVPDQGVTRNVLHLKGVPGDVIPDHAAQAGIDTIVMGTVGRTGIAGLIVGNTAETILSRVTCAVLAVKPEGFVSPVEG